MIAPVSAMLAAPGTRTFPAHASQRDDREAKVEGGFLGGQKRRGLAGSFRPQFSLPYGLFDAARIGRGRGQSARIFRHDLRSLCRPERPAGYSLGWLKPYEAQWLAYPPGIARNFDPELAALVGYRQHRPNLGNYEGQCPSVLLGADFDPDRPLGAIDALRPDQAALLGRLAGNSPPDLSEPK